MQPPLTCRLLEDLPRSPTQCGRHLSIAPGLIATCATNDEDGEVLVGVFGYGDCDGLHGELVLQVDLPPALPA